LEEGCAGIKHAPPVVRRRDAATADDRQPITHALGQEAHDFHRAHAADAHGSWLNMAEIEISVFEPTFRTGAW
jgi:hypothetical protein